MRILYSHYLSNDDHPAAQMVAAVSAELRKLGHAVYVHRSAGRARPAAAGPAKAGVFKRLAWFSKACGRNRAMYERDIAILRSFRPDVVLCRQDAYCVSMPAACRHLGVPLVTYADAPVAYETRHYDPAGRWHPPGLVERLEQFSLKRSRAVITVSRPAARILADYRVDVPIEVIPNGVDLSRFRVPDREQIASLRHQFGIATPLVSGFVGTFRPFHGLETLTGLIRDTKVRTDLTWVLIGDGPGREQLEAATWGNAQVKFLGRRPQAEIPALLSMMDVMVAPQPRTQKEFYFCPLKILEGLAAGLPVLASDHGDIPQMLDDGRAGKLIRSDSPEKWAAGLNGLLDDPVRRLLTAAAGLQHVRQYSWAATASGVETVLNAVVAAKSTAVRNGVCLTARCPAPDTHAPVSL